MDFPPLSQFLSFNDSSQDIKKLEDWYDSEAKKGLPYDVNMNLYKYW